MTNVRSLGMRKITTRFVSRPGKEILKDLVAQNEIEESEKEERIKENRDIELETNE